MLTIGQRKTNAGDVSVLCLVETEIPAYSERRTTSGVVVAVSLRSSFGFAGVAIVSGF